MVALSWERALHSFGDTTPGHMVLGRLRMLREKSYDISNRISLFSSKKTNSTNGKIIRVKGMPIVKELIMTFTFYRAMVENQIAKS